MERLVRTKDGFAGRNRHRFAAAHAARSLGWSTIDLMLAWHLHIVVGLSGKDVAILLFVFLFVGSATNLLIGYALTRFRARGQDYIALQLIGSIAAASLLVAQFLVMDPVWVAITGVAFRIAYAMQDIPQNALGSLLPRDADDANDYARLHVLLSAAARIVAIGGHLLLLRSDSAISRGAALIGIAIVMVLSAFGLRGVRFPVRPDRHAKTKRPLRAGLPLPDGLPRLLLGFGLAAMLLPTINRLLLFSPDPLDQSHLGAWMLGSLYVGALAGPVAQSRLVSIMSERNALLFSVAVVVASGSAMLLPLPSSIREFGAALHGLATSAIGVRLWADAASVAMNDERSAQPRDGLVFSAVIVTTHLSMAFGSLLLGPLIESYEVGDAAAAMAALALTATGGLMIVAMEISRKTTPALA